jgi:hypothetical protein
MAPKPKDIWGFPIPSPKDVVNYLNNAVNQGRIASGDRAAILPGDQGVRKLGIGISMTNDFLNPYANTTKQLLGIAAGNPGAEAKFAKSLAKDVVITGAGAGLGIAAVKGAKVVKNTGLPARVVNKAKGEIVVVHGTGRPVVGKTLTPVAGSPISPDIPAVSTWNTNYAKGKTGGQDWIHGNVQEYANRPYYDPVLKKEVPGQGNIVIGKTKLKDTLLDLTEPNQPVLLSGKPVPITKVIKDNPALSDLANKEIFIKELKKAGVKTKSSPVKSMLDKVEAAKIAKRQRIANENSPV